MLLACEGSTLTAAKHYIRQGEPAGGRQLVLALESGTDNPEFHLPLGTLLEEAGDSAARVDASDSSDVSSA